MAILNDRIRERRQQLGFTLLEIADYLGVQEATVQRYESGDIKNIKHDTVLRLSKILRCDPAYLMGWTDSSKGEYNTKSKVVRIPVYGKIAAGVPIEEIEDIDDWEEIDYPNGNNNNYIALRIRGDSMEPRICEGDVIIIRLQQTIENGELAAVRVNDGNTDGVDATCKRVKYTSDGGIMLISTNPDYPPVYYSKKDIKEKDVEIIGKVVELRGKF